MAGYATLNQLNTLSKNIEAKTLYTKNDNTINIDNLKRIKDCNKFSFVDFMELLNLKETTVSLSTTLSTLQYKIGTTVHGGTTLTVTVTKGSYDIVQIEFFIDGVSVSVETNGVTDGGVFTYGYGVDITTDKEFKVVVSDVNGNEVEDIVKVSFYNPYWTGKTAKEISDITSADILTMTQTLGKKENKKVKYTMSNERAIFAYDKSYGDLKSILDINSFENLSSFSKLEMTIDGALYYVYVLDTKVYCTDFEYNFIF